MTTRVKITHDQENYPMDLIVRAVDVDHNGIRTTVSEHRLKSGESRSELYVHSGRRIEVIEVPPVE